MLIHDLIWGQYKKGDSENQISLFFLNLNYLNNAKEAVNGASSATACPDSFWIINLTVLADVWHYKSDWDKPPKGVLRLAITISPASTSGFVITNVCWAPSAIADWSWLCIENLPDPEAV